MTGNFNETDIVVNNIIFVIDYSKKKEFVNGRKSGRLYHGLIYIVSGEALYYLPSKNARNARTFAVEQGNILSLTKGSEYDFEILSDEYHYIHLDFDIVCGNNNNDIGLGCNGDINARLTKLCDTSYKFKTPDNI
ncbi:MAG: hypothetical protein PHG48_08600, partial [Eubacteriales bacterium]|nr:hypothetical protein [Eubacteriales bacterium]